MVKIEFNEIKAAIQRLPMNERVQLAEELQRETLQKQFKQIFTRIDARLRKNPIPQKEINKIVKEAQIEYRARLRR